jgi:hypothetical protein
MGAVEQTTALGVDWRAVARGGAAGLAVIVPVTILGALLDHGVSRFDHSGWSYAVFLGILAAYLLAGWTAGAAQPEAPLTHGAVAAVAAVVAWVPLRIVVWLVRDEGRGLVAGDRAVLAPGQLFGALVIAAAAGMVGGYLAARRDR